jgi:hypothetical protein
MASLEPPLHPAAERFAEPSGGAWVMRCWNSTRGAAIDSAVCTYAAMAGALAANEPEKFNAALADLRSQLEQSQSKAVGKARAEVYFNQMEPFYNAMMIYVLAGLFAVFSWFNLSETLRRTAVWLTLARAGHSHFRSALPHDS